MNKSIFYKYDLYFLERKYPKQKFIGTLEGSSALKEAIEPFISNVTDLLYLSIKSHNDVEVLDVEVPDIDYELKNLIANNSHYSLYNVDSAKEISGFVFNKFLTRIFKKDGFNNETHIIQEYIHSWLEKELALQIVQDSRFSSLEDIKLLLDKTEMLDGFHVDLAENIPAEWVLSQKEEWTKVNVSPDKLLDTLRTYDKEYFNGYMYSISELSKENYWNYVVETTRFSEYMMLNDEYSFISSVLIKIDVSLWIEFWDNLKLPLIQDCVFISSFNFTPIKFLELVSRLTNSKISTKSDLKVLLFILSQNYFEASYKLTERLSIYDESERQNEGNKQIFQGGVDQNRVWLKEKKENYEKLIQFLKEKLSNSEIEEWLFSYQPRANSNQYKSNQIYNEEINVLTKVYKEKAIDIDNIDFKTFNLQKFNFYVDLIRGKVDKKSASILLDAIVNYVSSDKFYWDRTYAEPYWSAIKGMGFLISQQDNPLKRVKQLVDTFKTVHQGWNPSKIDYSPILKESFIYSGIALLFENEFTFKSGNEKEQFFKEFLHTILIQDKYSQSDNSEYYRIPLHLLLLVANQIFTEVKEYYEHELINNYDNFYTLLSILSNEETPICDSSRILLKERFYKEFIIIKRQFSNRKQEAEIHELEKMINNLNLVD